MIGLVRGEIWTFRQVWRRGFSLSVPTFADEAFSENERFVLFPNPVKDVVYLQINNKNIGKEYAIYNIDGKQVKREFFYAKKKRISLVLLEKGIYFIKVGEEKGMKFIKQ